MITLGNINGGVNGHECTRESYDNYVVHPVMTCICRFNPVCTKLSKLNNHPLEFACRVDDAPHYFQWVTSCQMGLQYSKISELNTRFTFKKVLFKVPIKIMLINDNNRDRCLKG